MAGKTSVCRFNTSRLGNAHCRVQQDSNWLPSADRAVGLLDTTARNPMQPPGFILAVHACTMMIMMMIMEG